MTFMAEIFAADLQPALWKTCDRFEATQATEVGATAGGHSVFMVGRTASESPLSLPLCSSKCDTWTFQVLPSLAMVIVPSTSVRFTGTFRRCSKFNVFLCG